jgi:hypothetical protein
VTTPLDTAIVAGYPARRALADAANGAPATTRIAALLDRAPEALETSCASRRAASNPAVLTERGLEAAVQTLVQRAPVSVEAERAGRLPEPVESAPYFAVSEGLANVA